MASAGFTNFVRCLSTTAARSGQLVKSPVPVFGIEGRYAHALYSAASKSKKLEVVDNDLKKVGGFMEKDAKFAAFVLDPSLKTQQKKAVIESSLKKQGMSDITVNALSAMAENGRLPKLNSVLKSFQSIMSAHRGEVTCSVTTAKELDKASMGELTTALSGFLKKGQTLQLDVQVDPSILGGMIITIGDKYVDMSTASKIKMYTNVIKEAI